jgi:hypothetical protein
LQRENDARRDLLLSLGVAVSAQELFIRNSVARSNRPGECLDGSEAVRMRGLEGRPSSGGEVERSGRCPAARKTSNLLPVFPDYTTTSDGTTACKIAASLITTNNALGYSAEELESMLQVGYVVAGVGDEDCRILNRVLFAVLAEISWAPP